MGVEPAQQAFERALALMQVHGQDLLGEPVVVFFAAVMQLADGGDVMTLLAQAVHPTGDGAVVGHHVVPVAGLVRVAASRHGRPRRAAQGAGAVGVGEAGAAARDGVNMRRLHHRVAIAAEDRPVVVVGDKNHEALGQGHPGLLKQTG